MLKTLDLAIFYCPNPPNTIQLCCGDEAESKMKYVSER